MASNGAVHSCSTSSVFCMLLLHPLLLHLFSRVWNMMVTATKRIVRFWFLCILMFLQKRIPWWWWRSHRALIGGGGSVVGHGLRFALHITYFFILWYELIINNVIFFYLFKFQNIWWYWCKAESEKEEKNELLDCRSPLWWDLSNHSLLLPLYFRRDFLVWKWC